MVTLKSPVKMLTEKQEMAAYLGVTALFFTGLGLAIAGGIAGATAMFGVGLGICVGLVVIGLIIRERNISS